MPWLALALPPSAMERPGGNPVVLHEVAHVRPHPRGKNRSLGSFDLLAGGGGMGTCFIWLSSSGESECSDRSVSLSNRMTNGVELYELAGTVATESSSGLEASTVGSKDKLAVLLLIRAAPKFSSWAAMLWFGRGKQEMSREQVKGCWGSFVCGETLLPCCWCCLPSRKEQRGEKKKCLEWVLLVTDIVHGWLKGVIFPFRDFKGVGSLVERC
ncbi:hypothetical protein E3N88_07001 [Mikania micrantha]|uniref:Uncharacterized protein n=1 Tax=Mikania micrantha TaxID=192012 RepID=A0A5N6PSD4_9ASTR|nr:hypothetical protein E3N88_07001 [Mikania micrantha]